MRLIILQTLICFFLTLRFSYSQTEVRYTSGSFPQKKVLKANKVLLKDELANPGQILLIDKNTVILNNPEINPSFHVVNLQTGKIINQFGFKGHGPGEIIYPFSCQLTNNNKVMVHDLNGKKLLFFELEEILTGKKNLAPSILKLSPLFYPRKVYSLSTGNYFVNLLGHKDGYSNCLMNSEGEATRFLTMYPKLGFDFNMNIASNYFGTYSDVSPDGNNIVAAYSDWDRIEVFDEEGSLHTVIKGPLFVDLNEKSSNSMANKVLRSGKTLYKTPAVGNNSFMVPFSGRDFRNAAYNTLYWFDNNGKPLANFTLDRDIISFAVDWDQRNIYGINIDMEPEILKFQF
jgi:hypothetical protein